MAQIDLQQFKPKAHPAKAVLKAHKVSIGTLARYWGVSYPYACNMLNGTFSMPQHHEAKLNALVQHLEGRT